MERATNKNAHEFAGFELGEAITVNEVLKDLGTKAAVDTNATALITKIKATDKGADSIGPTSPFSSTTMSTCGISPTLISTTARARPIPWRSRGAYSHP